MLQLVCGAEVRSYEVEVGLLQRARSMNWHIEGSEPDPFGEASDIPFVDEFDRATGVDWLGPVVKEAGFESRFLKKAGELRECWRRVVEVIGYGGFKGEAVYDVKNKRLIVKGELGLHRALRRAIENEMPIQLRTTFSVYELPGAGLEDRSGFWGQVPKEAKLLRELSWMCLPGQTAKAGSADQSIWAESEIQTVAYDSFMELRATVGVKLPEGGFTWMTGFSGVMGMRWAQEVGSLNGETTLMMVSKVDQVRTNGGLWDEWVLTEEGEFMHDERLEVIRPWRPSKEPDDGTVEQRRWTVPPYFENFLTIQPEDVDPFAADDTRREKFVPIRKLLEQNGITFREGDSVSFLRSTSTLIARLSKDNLELLDQIINARIGLGPPQVWSVELAEVEGEDFRKGKLLKKIGIFVMPGQQAEATLGGDLALQVEMQTDGYEEWVEMRLKLAEGDGDLDKAALTSGVVMRVGQPTVLRKTVENGKHRSWVATARVKTLENEVDQFLTKREGGK
ncbi:MAG: hypothetical protein P1U90_10940 [Akkermansiaceae bacterium]|nr:hypothetical protein [Akkermansiaceae bacterium]